MKVTPKLIPFKMICVTKELIDTEVKIVCSYLVSTIVQNTHVFIPKIQDLQFRSKRSSLHQ